MNLKDIKELIELVDDKGFAEFEIKRQGFRLRISRFKEANTVIFGTGERVLAPRELAPVILKMTNGSIYYHFLESRRRPPIGMDDFSAWLTEQGEEFQPYVDALGSVDFHFHNLAHLRKEVVRALLQAGDGK